LAIDSKFAKRESLYNTMKVIGKVGVASSENKVIKTTILEVPEVSIANYKLENVPTLLADESKVEAEFEDGVVGIALQSRFNFIIDYPNNVMYLKSNKYFGDCFEKKDNTTMNIAIGLSILIVFFAAVFIIYKIKKQQPENAN